MKLLGVILAGGQSRRFGSDKAVALFKGKPLIEHVIHRLRPQAQACVVAGRIWPGLESVVDLPKSGLGPISGLAGALAYAQQNGFDAVLSSGCDVPDLPLDLVKQLRRGPAIFADMPIVGLWPSSLAPTAAQWLANPANRSVYAFADYVGAKRIPLTTPLTNINRPEDLPKELLAQNHSTD